MSIIDLKKYGQAKKAELKAKRQGLIAALGEPTKNFFRVSHKTLEHPHFKELSPTAQMLYLWLCKYRNRFQRSKSYFTRSLRAIEKDTGLSRPTILKAERELVDNRFMITVKKKGGRTKYQIFEVQSG